MFTSSMSKAIAKSMMRSPSKILSQKLWPPFTNVYHTRSLSACLIKSPLFFIGKGYIWLSHQIFPFHNEILDIIPPNKAAVRFAPSCMISWTYAIRLCIYFLSWKILRFLSFQRTHIIAIKMSYVLLLLIGTPQISSSFGS